MKHIKKFNKINESYNDLVEIQNIFQDLIDIGHYVRINKIYMFNVSKNKNTFEFPENPNLYKIPRDDQNNPDPGCVEGYLINLSFRSDEKNANLFKEKSEYYDILSIICRRLEKYQYIMSDSGIEQTFKILDSGWIDTKYDKDAVEVAKFKLATYKITPKVLSNTFKSQFDGVNLHIIFGSNGVSIVKYRNYLNFITDQINKCFPELRYEIEVNKNDFTKGISSITIIPLGSKY